jgi:S1-C subfamily serine protease
LPPVKNPHNKTATTKTQRTRAQEFFGLQLQDLTAELADTMGYDRDAGVVIADVEQGSPAERAGFKRGLVISMLGRYRVSSPNRSRTFWSR